jgi:hypothetical protein
VRNLSVDFTAYSGFVPERPHPSGVQGSAAVRRGNRTRTRSPKASPALKGAHNVASGNARRLGV